MLYLSKNKKECLPYIKTLTRQLSNAITYLVDRVSPQQLGLMCIKMALLT